MGALVQEAGRSDVRARGVSRLRSVDPYWVVSAVLLVLLVAQTLNRRWSSDFWIHKSTIDTLRDSLLHPIHPFTGTRAKFEYYSPYTYAVAGFARVSGLSTIAVLQLAGIGNLVLFLVGFRVFVRELTNRLAVTFALLATLVFWGWEPWRWSGYLDLNSIGFALPYPSMFATALAMFVAWAVVRFSVSKNTWWLVLVAIGLPIVMLSHPITGLWTCLLLLALGIHFRLYRRPAVIPVLVAVAVAGAAVAVWPAYPFFRLIFGPKTIEAEALYVGVPLRLCASAVGVVPLWRRWQRDRTDPLALAFVAGAALFGLGWLIGNDNLARMLPLALLPLHVGIGELIASYFKFDPEVSPSESRRGAVAVWICASAVVGFVGISSGFASMVPHGLLPGSLAKRTEFRPITADYASLDGALPANSVVVVRTRDFEQIVAAHGYRPLSVGVADAFVPDAAERLAATREILAATTSEARRRQLLEKYGVAAVLCDTASCRRLFHGPTVPAGSAKLIRLRGS